MQTSTAAKSSIKNILLGGFLLILMVMLGVNYIIYRNITQSNFTNEKVLHTYEVLDNLGQLEANLWKLSSLYRGYVLVPNPEFQKTYAQLLPHVEQELKILRNLTSDNPIQQKRLDQLEPIVRPLITAGDKIIAFNKTNQLKSAQDLIIHNININLIGQTEPILNAMEAEENLLLRIRLTAANYNNDQVYLTISLASAVNFIILLTLYYFFWRNHQQRTRAEKTLQESETRFQHAAQASNDIIWDWDLINNTVWFNENVQKVFNYPITASQSTINWWEDCIHPDDLGKVNDVIDNAIKNNEPYWTIDYRFRRHDGSYAYVFDRGYIIRNENNYPIRMVGAMLDISERKKIEQLKNDFISSVSHELRTPLTSIRGSLGLILGNAVGAIPDKAKNLLDIAYQNCERLIRLINDILDIEKIEAGKMTFSMKPLDLTLILKDAIATTQAYAEKFNVTLKFTEPSNNFKVNVDYDRLMQVITNLISNAVKFSPTNGQVTLAVSEHKQMVRVAVSDQGKGITEEFKAQIFQKFAQADGSSTRASGGTGLGLSISKIIIEKLGGTIAFSSEPNKGTTFYFELPIWQDNMALKLQTTSIASRTVLICEDDQDLANLIHLLLTQNGFETAIAHSAADAKKLLAEKEFFAMTLDLILPDQNGISLIKELRKDARTNPLPIIVISGKAQQGRTELNGEGVNIIDWLDKPLNMNKLMAAISRVKHLGNTNMLNILHVEDDTDILKIVATILHAEAKFTSATTLTEAKQKLALSHYDLVILDLKLPDGSGIDLLPELASRHIPVVVFSVHELEEKYADYVSKSLVKSRTTNQELINAVEKIAKRLGG